MDLMNTHMLMWAEYGDHPHELFEDTLTKHDGYTINHFIDDISQPLNKTLYRFITKKYGMKTGELFELKNPTSWSSNLDITLAMSEEFENAYILKANIPVGTYNTQNLYGEGEYIIPPIRFKVVDINEIVEVVII